MGQLLVVLFFFLHIKLAPPELIPDHRYRYVS